MKQKNKAAITFFGFVFYIFLGLANVKPCTLVSCDNFDLKYSNSNDGKAKEWFPSLIEEYVESVIALTNNGSTGGSGLHEPELITSGESLLESKNGKGVLRARREIGAYQLANAQELFQSEDYLVPYNRKNYSGVRALEPTPVGQSSDLSQTGSSNVRRTALPPSPSSFVTPLYGSIHSSAYYFVDLTIGVENGQTQSLIVDTGSSVTAFTCKDCRSCGEHLDPPFDCSFSKTCRGIKCWKNCNFCHLFGSCHFCDIECKLCSLGQTR